METSSNADFIDSQKKNESDNALTFAQRTILKRVDNKLSANIKHDDYDFQDLHWDDVYSVYYDNFDE